MFPRLLRSPGVIAGFLIVVAIGYWWIHSRGPKSIATAYIGDRNVTLWSSLAQVRQRVTDVHYGERVEIVRQEGTTAQVRTATGELGWILDSRQMIDAALWQRSVDLLAHASTLPVQARGHTKAVSNLRVEPGRDGLRIFQFLRGTPVVVLERAVAADSTQSADPDSTSGKGSAGNTSQKPKQEDWLFVMRDEGSLRRDVAGEPASNSVPLASAGPVSGGPDASESTNTAAGTGTAVAGWILARFVELDPPGPVKDHATSSNMRVVAWFELNRVPDGSGGEAPQYLVAGSRGGEGQMCDFTILDVYTWGLARMRYETAYVESGLCGHLPIRVSRRPADVQFYFAEAGVSPVERTYVMHQTAVRRVKNQSSGASSKGH